MSPTDPAAPERGADITRLPFPELAKLSPFATLLERRIVFLRGAIEDSVADEVVAQLLALDADEAGDIELYIDSPGGAMWGLFAIYDTMQLLVSPVHTRCIGMAASAAAVILATGTGTRSATPNARIMLHQPHGGVRGTAADIAIAARETAWLRDRMLRILAERTGQTAERLRHDLDRDLWLSAEEALAYGVIDELATRRGDS